MGLRHLAQTSTADRMELRCANPGCISNIRPQGNPKLLARFSPQAIAPGGVFSVKCPLCQGLTTITDTDQAGNNRSVFPVGHFKRPRALWVNSS